VGGGDVDDVAVGLGGLELIDELLE